MTATAWKIIVTLVWRRYPVNSDMTDKIVVLTTCVTEEEAARIARMLVEERLATCVNVVPGVRSFYDWKGAVEDAREWLLIAKSSRELFEPLAAAIEKNSTYVLPEALALAVVDGSPGYLNWLGAGLRKGTAAE